MLLLAQSEFMRFEALANVSITLPPTIPAELNDLVVSRCLWDLLADQVQGYLAQVLCNENTRFLPFGHLCKQRQELVLLLFINKI